MMSFSTRRAGVRPSTSRAGGLMSSSVRPIAVNRNVAQAQPHPPQVLVKASEANMGAPDVVKPVAKVVDSEAPVSMVQPRPTDTVKAALLDAICGTERGLSAGSEVRAEVNELINQLEVKGGQGADVANLGFEGTWKLLYTNATDLIALLAVGRLPLPVKIGDITQTINASDMTVENSVQLQLPLLMTSLSTVSNYNIASPKRLQFTVQRGVLHTPSIEGNLELPSSITVMGQTLDLGPLREALLPLTRSAASLAASASDLLGQAPDLEVPMQTQSWQLTTYLDTDLRVSRGDGGAVYVFKKEVKPVE